jgi:hypothetical protein
MGKMKVECFQAIDDVGKLERHVNSFLAKNYKKIVDIKFTTSFNSSMCDNEFFKETVFACMIMYEE